VALALRLDRLSATSNYDGSDPASRALLGQMLGAWGWREVYEQTYWPPFHFWVLAWSQFLVGDVELGARLPGVLADSASAVLCGFLAAWLARSTLGDRWAPAVAALAAGLVVATSPISVDVSVLSYAEPVAVPVALGALIPLLAAEPARRDPLLSGTLLAVAAGIRWDCVALAPAVAILGRGRRRWSGALLPLLPAAVWMGPRPFAMAANTVARATGDQVAAASWDERWTALGDLVQWWFAGLGPLPLALAGFLAVAALRTAVPVLLALSGAWAWLVGTTLMGHVPAVTRYVVLAVDLTAILSGLGLAVLAARERRGPSWGALLGALLLLGAVRGSLAGRQEVRARRSVEDEVAVVVRRALAAEPARRVLVDPIEKTGEYIAMRAGLPIGAAPRFYRDARGDWDLAGDVDRLLHGWGPAMVVTVDGGDLEARLGLDAGCVGRQRIGDASAQCLGRHGRYRVWRMEPAPP
jgi:4-amino-4-deoxy-L-arabinose transferase-like glycosyltransferase